jgi:hypothetical protein
MVKSTFGPELGTLGLGLSSYAVEMAEVGQMVDVCTPRSLVFIDELGKAVQVEPIRPTLQAPGTKRLKPKHDKLLSSFAFNVNLRRYSWVAARRPRTARRWAAPWYGGAG